MKKKSKPDGWRQIVELIAFNADFAKALDAIIAAGHPEDDATRVLAYNEAKRLQRKRAVAKRTANATAVHVAKAGKRHTKIARLLEEKGKVEAVVRDSEMTRGKRLSHSTVARVKKDLRKP